MTTLELPWASILISDKLITTGVADIEHNVVQWHSEGSTLFIICRGRPEIDLRIEREICPIRYQIPDDNHGASSIALTMLRSRPVKWADGTNFEPGFIDRNTITLHFDINDDDRPELYKNLTTWLAGISCSEWTFPLKFEQAMAMWDDKTAHFRGVSTTGDAQKEANGVDMLVLGSSRTDGAEIILESSFGNLNAADVARLESGEWANDELVNFSLNHLKFEILKSNPDRKMHIMSSFLYTKITKQGYASAFPWVKDVDIFDMDFIIFPIHIPAHWLLIVLHGPKNMIPSGDRTSPNMYMLDSLADHMSEAAAYGIFRYITRFIRRAGLEREQALNDRRISHIRVKVPQQPNGSDCGFFMLHFAKVFASFPDRCRKIITKKPDVVSKIWGLHTEIGNSMRTELKDYIAKHQNIG